MKKRLYSRIIAIIADLVLIAGLCASPVKTAQAQPTSPITTDTILVSGQVMNAPANARVQAWRTDGTLAFETFVSPAGQYAFPPLPRMAYRLQVVTEQGRRLDLRTGSQVDISPADQVAPHEYVLRIVLPIRDAQPVPAQTQAAGKSDRDAEAADNGQITGTVTAAQGGAPLQYAYVYVYNSRTASTYGYVASAYTNASGVYTVTGLAAGTYYLRFWMTDYVPAYYNNKTSLADADAVNVTLNSVTSGINASLVMGGKISGTVTAAQGGAPLQSATVYVYNSRTASTYDYVGSDYTDSSGGYTVTGLATGTYYLRFSMTDYLPAYYNNKTKLADADGVSVTVNQVTSGINAALNTGGKITGTVRAAQGGALLKDVNISIYNSPTASSSIANATTDASGVYTATGLEAGNFYVEFSPPYNSDYVRQYYNNQPTLAAANAVSVTLGSVTGSIDAALATGGKVTGHVTSEKDGSSLKDVQVTIYSWKCSKNDLIYIKSATTDASGNYSISQLDTGTYLARFTPLSSGVSAAYIEEYYNNQPSVDLANPFSVTVGNTTGSIDAALTLGAQISGTVTAQDGGAALKNVYVSVYDSTGHYGYSASTDASGVYTVKGLKGGSYKVAFSPSSTGPTAAYLREYYNDKASLSSADTLNVPAGSVVNNINAVLARGGQFTGHVTAVDGGAPLEGVRVTAYNSQGYEQGYGYTDVNGLYTTSGLPSGSYRLRFQPSYGTSLDYLEEYYNDKSQLANADPIALTAPAQSAANAALARGGSISGKVTSTLTGAPLADIYVTALDMNGKTVRGTYTDANGLYTVRGLPNGAYHVNFSTSKRIVCTSLKFQIYYNQKPDLATADHVTVTPPGATANINGSLNIPETIVLHSYYLPITRR